MPWRTCLIPAPIDLSCSLRVALTTADFERLLKFYAEGLGIEPSAFWQNDGGRAAMLRARAKPRSRSLMKRRPGPSIRSRSAGASAARSASPCRSRTWTPPWSGFMAHGASTGPPAGSHAVGRSQCPLAGSGRRCKSLSFRLPPGKRCVRLPQLPRMPNPCDLPQVPLQLEALLHTSLAGATLGLVAIVPYSLALQGEAALAAAAEQARMPLWVLIAIQLALQVVVFGVAIWVGLSFAKSVGLGAPLLEKMALR